MTRFPKNFDTVMGTCTCVQFDGNSQFENKNKQTKNPSIIAHLLATGVKFFSHLVLLNDFKDWKELTINLIV